MQISAVNLFLQSCLYVTNSMHTQVPLCVYWLENDSHVKVHSQSNGLYDPQLEETPQSDDTEC